MLDTVEEYRNCRRTIPTTSPVRGLSKLKPPKDDEFGRRGAEADYFSKLRRRLAKMELGDQKLLLHMAQKVAR